MTSHDQRILAAGAKDTNRRKDLDRLNQQFEAVFGDDDGAEVLAHLQARFGLLKRVFIPDQAGQVCPLRAAVRDGERAVIEYILERIAHAQQLP